MNMATTIREDQMEPGAGILEIMIVLIIALFPFWKISTKAGFPGVMALLILVPLVNLIFLYYLALAPWPALQEAQESG